nr:hypothetical protein [Tanacetum cinerariifolium]
MCINCYRKLNSRSASCPFCQGYIERVMSRDLWVLTCNASYLKTSDLHGVRTVNASGGGRQTATIATS